ncbi:MAG: Rpn family recombination-promoting nuclease/putative transposase [Alphaproteobacteria bacterium]|nr:Rpn family recombination-promoting nuclease/putative transposase [Alphaproteobacteria bacterium]
MRHPIDPLVDYAFKRLFGEERNKNLLQHFLNAVLRLRSPIVELTLVDPALGKASADDKLCVVDVLAKDSQGRAFQVEVQLAVHVGLPDRILYNWAKLYQAQIEAGDDYRELAPALTVWLLRAPLFRGSERAHHRFELRDAADGLTLSDHLGIHVIELSKFKLDLAALDAESAWVYFLREARRWTSLPDTLDTPEMRQAMGTLRDISEQQLEYYRYNRRMDSERVKLTMERTLAEAKAEAEAAQAEAEAAQAEAEAAQAEAEAAQAEAEAAQAEAEAAKAALAAERAETEAAQAALAAQRAEAEAERAAAEAERAAAEAERAAAEAERAAAQAALAAKDAELEALRARLAELER